MITLPAIMTDENIIRLSELNKVSKLFSDSNVDMYLMGSWAVSALNNNFAVEHNGDIDIVVLQHNRSLDICIQILTSKGYDIIEERSYDCEFFISRWFRLQGKVAQFEIGDAFKCERISKDYVDNPIQSDLYGNMYKVVPLPWLISSYTKKRNSQFVNFLQQFKQEINPLC